MSESVDWRVLLSDLVKRGVSLRSIAERLSLPVQTVRGYLEGSHPAHWKGEALIGLWCEVTGQDADALARSAELTLPKFIAVQRAVRDSTRIASSLCQLEFAWFGEHSKQGAAASPFLAAMARRNDVVRFRVGIAKTPWDDRDFAAFLVHDDSVAARVQGAPHFVAWVSDWQTYHPASERDSAELTA